MSNDVCIRVCVNQWEVTCLLCIAAHHPMHSCGTLRMVLKSGSGSVGSRKSEDGKSFASWWKETQGTFRVLVSAACVQKSFSSTGQIPLTAEGGCTRTSVYNKIARSNSYSGRSSIKASVWPGKSVIWNIFLLFFIVLLMGNAIGFSMMALFKAVSLPNRSASFY